jgi:hypothetical protein
MKGYYALGRLHPERLERGRSQQLEFGQGEVGLVILGYLHDIDGGPGLRSVRKGEHV